MGGEKFAELVEKDELSSNNDDTLKLNLSQLNAIKKDFALSIKPIVNVANRSEVDFNFSIWKSNNVSANKITGYSIVTISLTQLGSTPGNISAHQLSHLARLARGIS